MSREETFQGKKWVAFARGSWLTKFFADISVLVNWEKDGEEIKNFRNADGRLFSRPQSTSFYFRKGLTWVRSPQAGTVMKQGIQLNVRLLPHGGIFTGDACALFPAGTELWGLLALLNSKLALMFMRLVGAERKVQVGHLASLPIAFAILKDGGLVTPACEAYDLLREWDRGNGVSTQHIKPWLLQVWEAVRGAWDELTAKSMTGHPLASAFARSDWESTKRIRMLTPNKAEPDGINLQVLAEACVEQDRLLRQRLEEIQRQIDDEVYRLYGIADEDRALIEAELRRVPEQEDAEEAGAEDPEEETLPEGVMPAEEHIRRLIHYLAHQVVREDADGIVPLHDIYTADGRLERGLAYKVRERLQDLLLETHVVDLRRQREVAQGRQRRSLEKQMAELNNMLDDLRGFAERIDAILQRGYTPHIDDGVLINMAPLWELMPSWQAEPKKCWEALARGDYDWSHQAMDHWPEWVRQKCQRNKSYAIAHGLT